MKRLYLTAILTLLFSFLIYGIIEWKSTKEIDTTSVNDEIVPDFVAEKLTSYIYNQAGNLSHVIEADRMEHYSELAVTKFELPKYTLYPEDKSPQWYINAKEGILNHQNNVRLNNRVLITASDESSLIKEVHGKYFELDLSSNIISSDQTIVIQGNDFTMYGSGLIVDLNTTQMTMTEHVQTVYKKYSN